MPNLMEWKASLASTRAGLKDSKMLIIGDSVAFGYLAGPATYMKSGAHPHLLLDYLMRAGFNAHDNNFYGGGPNVSPNNIFNDSRISCSASWKLWNDATNGCCTLGGGIFQAYTKDGLLTFTPTVPVDTFEVMYLQFTAAADIAVTMNGVAKTTLAGYASTLLQTKTIITHTLGTNTIGFKINTDPGNYGYIVGVRAWDSSKSWVEVINAGWSASCATTWASSQASGGTNAPCSVIEQVAPDLTLLALGTNDMQQSYELRETYIDNLQYLADSARKSGSIAFLSPTPCSISGYSNAKSLIHQESFVQALEDMAARNDAPFIDVFHRWGSWDNADALGFMGDIIHPSLAGHHDMASIVASSLIGG